MIQVQQGQKGMTNPEEQSASSGKGVHLNYRRDEPDFFVPVTLLSLGYSNTLYVKPDRVIDRMS
jgi:hypothetical protein